MRNAQGSFTSLELDRHYMQEMFWCVIHRDHKRVLRTLAQRPLKALRNAIKSEYDEGNMKSFFNAIIVWQRTYSLEVDWSIVEYDWIGERAVTIIVDWLELPFMLDSQLFTNRTRSLGFSIPEERPPPGMPEFKPFESSWEDYAKEVEEATKKEMESSALLDSLSIERKRQVIDRLSQKAESYAKRALTELSPSFPGTERSRNLRGREDALRWTLEACLKCGRPEKDIGYNASISRRRSAMFKLLGLMKPSHLKGGRPKGTKNKH